MATESGPSIYLITYQTFANMQLIAEKLSSGSTAKQKAGWRLKSKRIQQMPCQLVGEYYCPVNCVCYGEWRVEDQMYNVTKW